MEGNNKTGSFCVLCFHQKHDESRETWSPNEKGIINDGLQKSSLESDFLCSSCESVVAVATSSKAELEETERNVRRRQRELLRELRKFEEQVNNFKTWMVSVERLIPLLNSVSIDNILQRRCGDVWENQSRRKELLQFRQKVVKVIEDLHEFHGQISGKPKGQIITKPQVSNWKSTNSPVLQIPENSDADNHNSFMEPDDTSSSAPCSPPDIKLEINEELQEIFEPVSEPLVPESNDRDLKPTPLHPPIDPSTSFVTNEHDPEEESAISINVIGINPEPDLQNLQQDPLGANESLLRACTVCGMVVNQNSMASHMKIHNASDKTIKCDFCEMTFSSNVLLAVHWKTVHPGVKPFACVQCEDRFFEKAALRDHVRVVHGRKYISRVNPRTDCHICGKSINRRTFHKHLKVHAEDRFVCEFCNGKFVQYSHLRYHACKARDEAQGKVNSKYIR